MTSAFTAYNNNTDFLGETDKQQRITNVLLCISSPNPVFHPQSKRKQITGSGFGIHGSDCASLMSLGYSTNECGEQCDRFVIA